MPLPPYTVTYNVSSSGIALARSHPSPTNQERVVCNSSYGSVLPIYQSLVGPDKTSSQVGTPNSLCLDGTSIPGTYSTESLLPRIYSTHMHPL